MTDRRFCISCPLADENKLPSYSTQAGRLDIVGLSETLRPVGVKVAATITDPDMFSEALEKEVCKTAQQEISSYRKEWVLNDLFSCRSLLSKSA